MKLTIDSARALRDGGIDALAALDAAVTDTLALLPEADHGPVKRAMGKLMATVIDETINRAIHSFPELNPNRQTWTDIVKDKTLMRLAAMGCPKKDSL